MIFSKTTRKNILNELKRYDINILEISEKNCFSYSKLRKWYVYEILHKSNNNFDLNIRINTQDHFYINHTINLTTNLLITLLKGGFINTEETIKNKDGSIVLSRKRIWATKKEE